jgi:hypothetical protein
VPARFALVAHTLLVPAVHALDLVHRVAIDRVVRVGVLVVAKPTREEERTARRLHQTPAHIVLAPQDILALIKVRPKRSVRPCALHSLGPASGRATMLSVAPTPTGAAVVVIVAVVVRASPVRDVCVVVGMRMRVVVVVVLMVARAVSRRPVLVLVLQTPPGTCAANRRAVTLPTRPSGPTRGAAAH